MSQEEVIAWADDKMLNCKNIEPHIFDALMYFSLMDTEQGKDHKYIHDDFSLADDFALRVSALDYSDSVERDNFNNWLLGRSSEFYQFCNLIGEYVYFLADHYDEFPPTKEWFSKRINELKGKYSDISKEIWSRTT